MNTPSHFLLHAAIRKYVKKKKNLQIPKSFLLGSIAPDILLFVLVFSYIPLSLYIFGNTSEYTFRHMFDTLYFEHPLWIFSYNMLHSPMMLAIFFVLLRGTRKYFGEYYRILFWFLIGCSLHSLFDIPLHHDDGPRIFYPFSDYIFSSPVSYWDRNHYGNIVAPIELFSSLVLLIYVLYDRVKSKLQKN